MISTEIKEKISRPSWIRAMFEKGNQMKKIYGDDNVFDFTLGNPDLPPPKKVNETVKSLIERDVPGLHGYMSNSGFEDVREKIAEGLNKKTNAGYTRDSIVMTCGAAGGLNIFFKSVLEPGDEVIAIAPYFVEYGSYVENFRGRLVVIKSDPKSFSPDPGVIEKAITAKTKAIILNSPNNPSGAVYSKELLQEISDILVKKEAETGRAIYVVSDEPYKEIVYDGAVVPELATVFKNSISVYSFSKTLSLAGERIGYIAVSPNADDYGSLIAALIFSNRTLGYVNAPSMFQKVIAQCLDEKVEVDIYKRKRDKLHSHLTNIGFKCFLPKGAFYLFPQSPIEDDAVFCNEYAMKYNILAAPGAGFGFPGYFRLAYCVSDKTVELSLPAFEKLAKELCLK